MLVTIYSMSEQQAESIRGETLNVFQDLGISGKVVVDNDEIGFARAGVMSTPAVSVNGRLITNGWAPAPRDLAEAFSGGRY